METPHAFIRGHTAETDMVAARVAIKELRPHELLSVLTTAHAWRHLAADMIKTGAIPNPFVETISDTVSETVSDTSAETAPPVSVPALIPAQKTHNWLDGFSWEDFMARRRLQQAVRITASKRAEAAVKANRK